MPIFGQVWLWSSLAFLLGAFLCWALVARPARKRVGQLQAELNSRVRRQQPPQRPGRRRRSLDEQYDAYDAGRGTDRDASRTPARATPDPREETFGDLRSVTPEAPAESSEPLTRAYALPKDDSGLPKRDSGLPTREPGKNSRGSRLGGPPPSSDNTDTELADGPAAATSYFDLSGGALEAPPEVPSQPGRRGWFDSDAAASGEPLEGSRKLESFSPEEFGVGRLVDDEAEQAPASSGGTIFNQHTHPIPGEVIREIDEAGKVEAARTDEPADGLVDDLADLEPAGGKHEQIVESEPAPLGESELGKRWAAELTSRPGPDTGSTTTAPDPGAGGQTEIMPVIPRDDPPPEPVPATAQRSVVDDAPAPPGVTAPADPANAPLPKRVPGKPRGHTPFGVQTSTPPEPEPAVPGAPAQATEADGSRSLFEPVVPAEESEVVPPPHRVRGNGRGPFGPGSAMPLPDGGSPSPEFTIKASVSALRYCTPESPQFGRTVAEVWFKSPADAERVGFRPVS